MSEESFTANNEFNGGTGNVFQAGRIEVHHNGPPVVVPQEGPAVRRDWTGRARDLDEIEAALRHRPVAIHGEEGAGKTAVAAMLIDRNRDRYPGGQIYVDLDGGEASTAMRSLLIRLNVDARQIPPTLEGMAPLYRSVTRDRPLLVVVDGVTRSREAEQFRPAAATAGCLAVARIPLRDPDYFEHEIGPLAPDAAADWLVGACPNLADGVAPRPTIASTGLRRDRPSGGRPRCGPGCRCRPRRPSRG